MHDKNLSKEEMHSIRVVAKMLYTNVQDQVERSLHLYKELDKAFVEK